MQTDSGLVLIKRYFDLVEAKRERERPLRLLSISHYHVQTRLLYRSDKDVWGLHLSHYALQELVNHALKAEEEKEVLNG
ncbi:MULTISPECIES: hypothetical protein [Cyanophyceae]|uniref:hypothetical protein n=1 Tax=Cyanophyceae TaxID=3028117 RepID=UPI001681F620|nr:hypothetical protein [Trichocoleus sp. FACHB-40]MBD2001889.1 hypothetical protein [Trichocoleus sp. FACHB-40]